MRLKHRFSDHGFGQLRSGTPPANERPLMAGALLVKAKSNHRATDERKHLPEFKRTEMGVADCVTFAAHEPGG
jgi:hypothetical protein